MVSFDGLGCCAFGSLLVRLLCLLVALRDGWVGCVNACDCLVVVVLVQGMVGLWFVLAGVTCVLLGFSVLLLVIGLAFGLCLIDCGLLNCLLGCCGVT